MQTDPDVDVDDDPVAVVVGEHTGKGPSIDGEERSTSTVEQAESGQYSWLQAQLQRPL